MKKKVVYKMVFAVCYGIALFSAFQVGRNVKNMLTPKTTKVFLVKHDEDCLKMDDIYKCKTFDDGEILLYSSDGKIYTFDEFGFKFWE